MNVGSCARIAVITAIALIGSGCGGGGGGTQPPASAPVLSNLMYSPQTAPLGSGTVTVNGTVDFSDANGDLATITLTIRDPSGAKISSDTSPVTGAAGVTSGTISGIVQITPTVAGVFTIEVSAHDAGGAASNTLSGTFQVVTTSAEAKLIAQTGPGPNALTAANGRLYWAETGEDAIRSVSTAGGSVTTLAQRMPGALSMAFSGSDIIWLSSGEPSAACSTRVLRRTVTNGPTTVIANGSACAAGIETDVDLAVVGSTVYWLTSTASPNTYTINSTPVAGGPTAGVLTSTVPIVALFGYGATLYWMERDPSTGSTSIRSVSAGGPVSTIATGIVTSSAAMAVDSASVYYAAGGSIMAQPLAGGPPMVLAASTSVQKLSVAGQTLVWAGSESLQTVPTSGGSPMTLATYPLGRLRDFAFDGTHVFWSEANDGVTGVVNSVPVSGGSPSIVYQGALATGLALDGSGRLYWIESGISPGCSRIARLDDSGNVQTALTGVAIGTPIMTVAGTNLVIADYACIKTIPLAGGVPTLYPVGTASIVSLASSADGAFVYWVNAVGTVNRLEITDGSVTVVAGPGTGSGLPPQPGAIRLAPNGTLYWFADPQTILSAPAAASNASPTVVANGLQGASDLAVDNSNLYISDQTGILKQPLGAGGTPTLLIGASTTGAITQLALDGSTLYWLNGGSLARVNTDGSAYAEVIEFDSTGTSPATGPVPPMTFALDSTSAYFTEPWALDVRATPK